MGKVILGLSKTPHWASLSPSAPEVSLPLAPVGSSSTVSALECRGVGSAETFSPSPPRLCWHLGQPDLLAPCRNWRDGDSPLSKALQQFFQQTRYVKFLPSATALLGFCCEERKRCSVKTEVRSREVVLLMQSLWCVQVHVLRLILSQYDYSSCLPGLPGHLFCCKVHMAGFAFPTWACCELISGLVA